MGSVNFNRSKLMETILEKKKENLELERSISDANLMRLQFENKENLIRAKDEGCTEEMIEKLEKSFEQEEFNLNEEMEELEEQIEEVKEQIEKVGKQDNNKDVEYLKKNSCEA